MFVFIENMKRLVLSKNPLAVGVCVCVLVCVPWYQMSNISTQLRP